MAAAAQAAGLPEGSLQLVRDTTRASSLEMMGLTGYLDVLIPRGGAGLIRTVVENSRVPVIETGVGNCHLFLDETAEPDMAVRIAVNGKTSRPSVCNALEKLLVHQKAAAGLLPLVGRALAEKGVREIVLVAQDTTYYGKDLYHKPMLAELLRRVAAVEGVHWVRALYCYPELIDDELLAVMKEEPKVCSYLDIPLQHINDKVLREMNRRGDGALIRGLYRKIRGLGGFALRTTLIAGFPGETEEEFQELLQFVQACPFDRLGVFAYSEEEGTPAAARQDQVPMRVRKAREGKIMRAQQKISRAFNESRIGSVCEVLVEGREENGLYYGRSQWEAPETDGKVYIKLAEGLQEGSFVRVRITDAQDYDITGVLE